MRLRLIAALAALPFAIWMFVPIVAGAQGEGESVETKIDRTRSTLRKQQGQERVLVSDIRAYGRRIDDLQADITVLQAKQIKLQADLDDKRAELALIQDDLRTERMRLVRLRARLAQARTALSIRLVDLYKADKPDFVTVILEADGFAELIERGEFMQRISDQDKRIIRRVKDARVDALRTEKRLDKLEKRQTKVAAIILGRRNQVATIKSALVDRRDRFRTVRAGRADVLADVRFDRRETERDLAALERQSARVAVKLRPRAAESSPAAGPVRRGSGKLIWPINGPITSPFGPRWGRLHAGLDIGAPEGTPIRAADSGRVVLAGWEGAYGNYTCIDHGGGFATCYAHQSSIGVRSGESVGQGDVIGAVGNTGRSFGAHLHFETRSGGTPQNPLNYL